MNFNAFETFHLIFNFPINLQQTFKMVEMVSSFRVLNSDYSNGFTPELSTELDQRLILEIFFFHSASLVFIKATFVKLNPILNWKS